MVSFQQQIRKAASSADSVGRKRNGNVVVRKGYFYGMMADGFEFAEKVEKELTNAGINVRVVEYGNHWAAFKGGGSIAQGSHYWAELEEV